MGALEPTTLLRPRSRLLARFDNRAPEHFRPLSFERGFTDNPAGSVVVRCGRTIVLCTVSITDSVPPWLTGQNQAWLTAEYAMLPGSTRNRKARERGVRIDGRSQEIQRLIGRTLRSVVDLRSMPEVTLWADCDVLSADGGTRTTAINGAAVALHDALAWLQAEGRIGTWPLRGLVSAMSVGIVKGRKLVDLDYREDAAADVDLNVVRISDGRLVEVQGSAEGTPFASEDFHELVAMAQDACAEVERQQRDVLGLG